MEKKSGNWVKSLGNAVSMAASFAAAVALGYFVGSYLDSRLGTEPYLMLILLLLGVATGLKIMYEQAFGKRNDKSFGEEDGITEVPAQQRDNCRAGRGQKKAGRAGQIRA